MLLTAADLAAPCEAGCRTHTGPHWLWHGYGEEYARKYLRTWFHIEDLQPTYWPERGED